MQTDPLADFLTQIRNANQAAKTDFTSPYSKIKARVAQILKEEGYIEDAVLENKNNKPVLLVKLKQGLPHERPIRGIRRISKPGLRVYRRKGQMPRVLGGLGISIVSTSKGIMTGDEAKKQNVGGELLAIIW